MADFIPINGKLLTFGLTWITISQSKKESGESIALSRTAQADYRVRYAGKEIKYGLAKRVIDNIGEQPKGTLLSAALLFSEYLSTISSSQNGTQNNALVVQIDDKKIAVIALLKGTPYLDIVVKSDELDSQLTSLFQEGHDTFTVYGNLPAHVTHFISPTDLLSENTALATLIRFTDPRKKFQRAGLIILVLGVICILAIWKKMKASHETEEAAKNSIDPIQIYTENSSRILVTANFNGEAAYNTIWQTIKKREINVAGWSLKNIKCTPTQCEELWQQENGSFNTLRQQIHSPQTIHLQSNRETSVITYPLAGKKTTLVQSTLPKKDALWIDLITQQQRFKRINPLLVFTPKPAEIRGLTSSIMASNIPINLLVYSGEMTVSAPLGLAADTLQNHLRNVMINEVSINTSSDIRNATIQIKGTYYAQH